MKENGEINEVYLSICVASLIEASDDEMDEEEEAIPPERLKPRVSSFMIKKRVVKPEENGQLPNDDELKRLSRSHSEVSQKYIQKDLSIYLSIYLSGIKVKFPIPNSPVDKGCRICRLHLCKEVRPAPQRVSLVRL